MGAQTVTSTHSVPSFSGNTGEYSSMQTDIKVSNVILR